MAVNKPIGDRNAAPNARVGAVRKRTQAHNPKTNQWVKRDKTNGQFMDVKQDGKPFKGVTKEK